MRHFKAFNYVMLLLTSLFFTFTLTSCDDEEDEIMGIGDTEIEMVCDGNGTVVFDVIADELGIDWGDYTMQRGTIKGKTERFQHKYISQKASTIKVVGTNIQQIIHSDEIVKVTVKKSPNKIEILSDPTLGK